jgi:LacI family transcriptional regulator
VPQDVKLIGFDGIALATVVPELSTIAQPIAEMGKLATHYLMRQIRNEPVECKTHELDVRLLVRQSTTD